MPATRTRGSDLQSKLVQNPGKGLNNLISDSLINDTEASDLQNIQFVESGAVSKRYGHTSVGTGLSNNPKGLGSLITTSVRQLLTVDGTALKYLNGTTWTSISGATFTTAKNTTFVQAGGFIFIHNGTDAASKYDGSTLSRPTTTVSSSFGIYYKDRHLCAGVTSQPNRLYITGTTNLDDFTNASPTNGLTYDGTTHPGSSAYAGTDANYIDVAKNDGDKITGLAKFQDALVIFKERAIYQLTFDTSGTPTVASINNSIGCVSHRSIDQVDNDVFFLSRNGYYVLGNEPNYINVIRTNELSARIHPVIETITAANLSNTASIFSGYMFYSSVSTGGTTTNNKSLTYDKRYLAWSVSTNVNANAFTEFIDSSNVKHLYYAADDEAKVYEIDTTYSDNGTAIDSYWVSKNFDMEDFSTSKRFVYIDFYFRQLSGSVTITTIVDGTQTVSTKVISVTNDTAGTIGSDMWGSPMWGGSALTSTTSAAAVSTATVNVPYRLKVNKKARSIKFKIANANNNENFVFLGFIIRYRGTPISSFPSALKIQ